MSSTIKRQNHRIHPCNTEQKNALIQFLIQQHNGKNILIVTSNEVEGLADLANTKNITLLSDAELAKSPDLRCDVLISYDLPEKAILYMSRFARAGEYALILLDTEDQKAQKYVSRHQYSLAKFNLSKAQIVHDFEKIFDHFEFIKNNFE